MKTKRTVHRVAHAAAACICLTVIAPADAGTITVTSSADAGAGTLRDAINTSNGVAGTDTICFDITFLEGAGPHTITLASSLPVVTDTVIIDGFTEPGSVANSNPITQPVNAVHMVIIDGGANDVLFIGEDDCIVRGLKIHSGDLGIKVLPDATDNRIEGNEIFSCIDPAVEIDDSTDNFVGTNGDGANDDAERNVIRDCDAGVRIINGGGFNYIAGNFIGIEADGTSGDGNGDGVVIEAGSIRNRIGTNGDGLADLPERNVISSSSSSGVLISGIGANDNVVAGNLIGTDRTGTQDLLNGSEGVLIEDGAQRNLIGTDGDGVADAAERNLISANECEGVEINGPGSDDNVVAGNFIGTEITGQAALPNGDVGVYVTNGAMGNVIGTNGDGSPGDAVEGNVISGNSCSGVELDEAGAGNVVAGNYIGTDVDGTDAVPNGEDGIFACDSSMTRIGTDFDGTSDALERNVISGNEESGIDLREASQNVIAGNFIGTNAAGTGPIPNLDEGVLLANMASNNRIGIDPGGPVNDLERNVISANLGVGVYIISSSSNTISGNFIGTNAAGADLGNALEGVWIEAAAATRVGANATMPEDPARGNVIAFNGLDGVTVLTSPQGVAAVYNQIVSNSIHSNGGLGIDLEGDGVTFNDLGDADFGSNQLQNFPNLTNATVGGVEGSLNSNPNQQYVIEIFASTAADPSGFGEGEVYLARVMVTTDGAGNAPFAVALVVPPGMRFLTATATALNMSPGGPPQTSEFSPALALPQTCDAPGRPALDGTTDRVLRGYVVGWAVNQFGEEIRWNHLKGEATIVNYRDQAAWEYNTYNHAVVSGVANGDVTGTPGVLNLDGVEYAPSFAELLLNFQAAGSNGFSSPPADGFVITSDTDLTLLPPAADLRQNSDGPVTTKASFDIWNENETKFSGTHRCITCWDQTLLSRYDTPNHFRFPFLQTNHGKARIDGHAADVCNVLDDPMTPEDESVTSIDAPLLGVAARLLSNAGAVGCKAAAGTNLVGLGVDPTAVIRYDAGDGGGPPESQEPGGFALGAPLDARAAKHVRSLIAGVAPAGANAPAELSGPTQDRVSGTEKGSLFFFSKVEIRWDENGTLAQDTFLSLTNDYPEDVRVQMYFINGDAPLIEDPNGAACFHPGWNWVDVAITLTANEPTYWSALTGQPKGVSPFTVLDP